MLAYFSYYLNKYIYQNNFNIIVIIVIIATEYATRLLPKMLYSQLPFTTVK